MIMRIKLGMLVAFSIVTLPVMASAQTRVVVFFTESSAQVDHLAGALINEAAELARQRGAGTVIVTGFADNTGAAKATARLSSTRVQFVVDQPVADGVPQRRIRVNSKTAAGSVMSSLKNHRATIDIPLR